MSSDIYIPLTVVLNNPNHFRLEAVLNGSISEAVDSLKCEDPDWDWIKTNLEPVLVCQFWPRKPTRIVSINDMDSEFLELHVSCGGEFRSWFVHWLDEHQFEYTMLD